MQAHCQRLTVSILVDHIEQYKSLFRGREDIYAIRWEKEGKYGYMPAYKIDYFEKMFKQRNRYYKKLTKEVNV